jgi:hypothetical protein
MRRCPEISALRVVNSSDSGEIFRPKFLIPGYTFNEVVIQRSGNSVIRLPFALIVSIFWPGFAVYFVRGGLHESLCLA